KSTAAGALVSTSTEGFGDGSHVQASFAAQTHAVAAVGEFTEKSSNFDAVDCQSIVHQPFTVLINAPAPIHLFTRYPDQGETALPGEIGESRTQKPHFRRWVREINVAGASCGIGSCKHQFARQGKSVLVGSLKHEGTCVRKNRRVKAGGHLG